MREQKTFLVFGATGQTGRHFVSLALQEGHVVRALVRDPAKLAPERPRLEVHQGSITDDLDWDALLRGTDFVIAMIGDAETQQHTNINTAFVQALVPAMRRQGVTRFLYQAGAFSATPEHGLPPLLRIIRSIVARRYLGQHRDNEAVMRYLATEADDLEWMVHRAALGPDAPSKGVLQRSARRTSIATFVDCAAYNLRTLQDPTAVHTCSVSHYSKR